MSETASAAAPIPGSASTPTLSVEQPPYTETTAANPQPAASPVLPTAAQLATERTSTPVPSSTPASEPKAVETTAEHGERAAVPATPTAPVTTTSAPPAYQTPTPTTLAQGKAEGTVETSEPQNSLTNRFTEAEWASLKELRRSLPDIFAEGYTDNPEARDTPITLWGVRIDPRNPKDARVSVVLMKFLRARNLSVRDAREMLVSTLRWRAHFDVDAAVKEEFPEDVFGRVGHIYGRDKEGRPIVYNLYGGPKDIKVLFSDVQRFIRWRVALMEKSMAMLDFTEIDQMVQIHDHDGVSLTSRDANSKSAATEATSIFQNYYPESLYKKFFINVPTLLNWIFWAFKPFISATTFAKLTVVGTGHYAIKKALLPFIDETQLPKRYGGMAEAF